MRMPNPYPKRPSSEGQPDSRIHSLWKRLISRVLSVGTSQSRKLAHTPGKINVNPSQLSNPNPMYFRLNRPSRLILSGLELSKLQDQHPRGIPPVSDGPQEDAVANLRDPNRTPAKPKPNESLCELRPPAPAVWPKLFRCCPTFYMGIRMILLLKTQG